MADNDHSILNLRYNFVTQGLEGFGGGTPQWTPLPLVADGGISQLTGDVTAGPGSGSQAATLATVNINVGSFTNANVTVDGKGRITAVSSGTGAAPGGSSGAVQFNNTGAFGGSDQFTWDDSTTLLTLTNTVTNPDIRIRADSSGEVIHFTSTDDLTTYGFLSMNPAHDGVISLVATKTVQVSGGNGAFSWSFGDDGTITSPSAKISNLADPTDPQDAATKAYVDATTGGTPGGGNTAIQFNNSGSFGGDETRLFWDGTNFAVANPSGTSNIQLRNDLGNAGVLQFISVDGGTEFAHIAVEGGEMTIRTQAGNIDLTSTGGRIDCSGGPVGNVGSLGVGTVTPNTSAIVDMVSITTGVLFPRMTTVQKNAITTPAEGLVVYDLTLHKLSVWTGAAWQTVTSV